MTIGQALTWGREQLTTVNDAEFSARFLLSDILDLDLTGLTLHLSETLTAAQEQKYQNHIKQRLNQKPLAYIVSYQYFDGLRITVSPDTLIPRPETELLVAEAFAQAMQLENPVIYDIGTGSGAIAIALASRLQALDKTFHIYATDISETALTIAKQNTEQHGLDEKISVCLGNLLEIDNLPPGDIILANLPYIPTKKLSTLSLKGEPALALDGGQDGLDYYRELLDQLQINGWSPKSLLFEIDETHGDLALQLLKAYGYQAALKKDLNAMDRIVIAK
jgi:release factor glutamine methyltransferase